LRIPAPLAPNKVAILPLTKKDGLPEKAMEIMNELKFHVRCFCEEKDAIGKRYRRQDAIGTPYCVTVDHQTLQDNTVTIRNRDTMEQERVSVSSLKDTLTQACSINNILKRI
jgi:glycyl-tRNA synthetase